MHAPQPMDAVATTTAAQLFSTECGVRFSEYYDTSPPLPRPLRSRFPLKFVTAAGMKSETRSVAPLNDKEKSQIIEDGLEHYCVTNADDTTMRYVKRNIIYMNKAAEFALIHQELAFAARLTHRRMVGGLTDRHMVGGLSQGISRHMLPALPPDRRTHYTQGVHAADTRGEGGHCRGVCRAP